MTLWTSADMKTATSGILHSDFAATGISIDTRTLSPGEVFVALKGDTFDGHDFIEAAIDAGAAGVIAQKEYPALEKPHIRVEDTLRALEDLGRAARARTKASIIGVTGSAGKTGTKEMLRAMFEKQGPTHASQKSYNNHWGVPLTLANMPIETQFGVFEMGMNHKGEIEALSNMVRPDIALITTIEPVHIEHFESVEEIAAAKAEIFKGMTAEAVAILPFDNPHFQTLKKHAEKAKIKNILSFGEDEEADAHLLHCSLRADSSKVIASIGGVKLNFKISIPGQHIVMNAMAALLAVKAAGGDIQKAVSVLADLIPVEGRGNRYRVTLQKNAAPLTIIDDSYNANPASMRAAFAVLEMAVPQDGGRRIAVLGDMLELGPTGPQLHAELANPLLKAKTDKVFCCGPQMEALYNVLPPDWRGGHAKDSQQLAVMVADMVKPGDIVLVKGSFGSKMSYVVHALEQLEQKEGRHAV